MPEPKKIIPADAKLVFKGVLYEVWQWQQKMFDGSFATFERLKRQDSVQVVAVVDGKILIEDQEQPARKPFVSVPGGRIDEGEDIVAACKRELLEETGYSSDDWTFWRQDAPSNTMDWTIYTYVARNCARTSEPHPDAGEKISLRLIDFEEFLLLSDSPNLRGRELKEMLLHARLDENEKSQLEGALFHGSN